MAVLWPSSRSRFGRLFGTAGELEDLQFFILEEQLALAGFADPALRAMLHFPRYRLQSRPVDNVVPVKNAARLMARYSIASFSLTPSRTMFVTADRRRSWKCRPGTPAALHTVSQSSRKSTMRPPVLERRPRRSSSRVKRKSSTALPAEHCLRSSKTFPVISTRRASPFFVSPGSRQIRSRLAWSRFSRSGSSSRYQPEIEPCWPSAAQISRGSPPHPTVSQPRNGCSVKNCPRARPPAGRPGTPPNRRGSCPRPPGQLA